MYKTLLIKIDRRTIRKNPTAGNTSTLIHTGTEVSFYLQGNSLPSSFKEGIDVIITEEVFRGHIKGILLNVNKLKKLQKVPNCSITIKNNIQRVNHLPEPNWFYKFQNPLIKCSHCGNLVRLNEIEENSNDDAWWQICPICKAIDSFGTIIYEQITDVKQ